jgi:hypothetical protein
MYKPEKYPIIKQKFSSKKQAVALSSILILKGI